MVYFSQGSYLGKKKTAKEVAGIEEVVPEEKRRQYPIRRN
jgi:hypothetical protein